MLTVDQKNKWNNDGYLKLERFFDAASIKKISDFTNEIASWDISEDKWMMWFEKTKNDHKILSKVENFLDYHSELCGTLLSDKRVETCVREVLDEEVKLLKELLIYKYPDSGGYRPHQDIYHIGHGLANRQVHAIVTIAIDRSASDNGGLYMSPGNHKNGIFDMDKNSVICPEISQKFKWEPITSNPGDMLIFDNYVPHYSEPNKSNNSRRTMYLVFQRESTQGFSSRKEYNARKREVMPPEGKNIDINNLKKINDIFYRD